MHAAIADRGDEFIDWITRFARDYAALARDDHRLFVEAFRNNEFSHVHSTTTR